jgi:enterochelin esterase-like enzyme
MLRALALAFLLLPLAAPHAQEAPDALPELRAALAEPAALDALWSALREAGQVPFRAADSAAFLWRGEADSVFVAGDHTGWAANPLPLTRVPGTDLWLRAEAFPEAARLDYKLVVDGDWRLDPNNPHVQMSGFGPNSELRMPGWRPAPETLRPKGGPAGTLSPEQTLYSEALRHALTYRVYTPPGYEGLADLPVIYATDGHEYADDGLGAATAVLDGLIASGRMEPALAVFVDPRVEGENVRHVLYLNNPAFAAFVAEDLTEAVDAAYRTRATREGRAILGTSFGGVFAGYLGGLHPEVFGKLIVQSPALWVTASPQWEGPSVFDRLAEVEPGSLDVVLTVGTVNDGAEPTRRLREVLQDRGHRVTYREVPEGHSWGQWRALLPEAFTTLFPPR